MDASIEKYLQKYAEPEVLKRKKIGHFQQVIVIPSYDEKADFLKSLFTNIPASTRTKTLAIVVVNVPDDLHPNSSPYKSTHALLKSFCEPNCLIIDRVSKPIPRKMGVGLARKIGADVALAYIRDGLISTPIIYTTDADAELPKDYFLSNTQRDVGAWLYPFKHRSKDNTLENHAICYELHMRWYVDGLRRANSYYAHHTLGSTIAINAKTYADVRGYPKRNAGEDFYLLNKIAKTAPIHRRRSSPLVLEARASTRVPFGTGPAILNMPENHEDYTSYNPKVFEALALALKHVSDPNTQISLPISNALETLNFTQKCRDLNTKQRHQWFDGLKTLRFVHAMQEHYPDIPLLPMLRTKYDLPKSDLRTLLAYQRNDENAHLIDLNKRQLSSL